IGNRRAACLYLHGGRRGHNPALRRGLVDTDGSRENDGRGLHAACLIERSADGPVGSIPVNCRSSLFPGGALEFLRMATTSTRTPSPPAPGSGERLVALQILL